MMEKMQWIIKLVKRLLRLESDTGTKKPLPSNDIRKSSFLSAEDRATISKYPDIFWDYEGELMVNEGKALAQLLLDDVLFCNERNTAMRPFKTEKREDGAHIIVGSDDTKPWEVSEESTTVLYVNCNDLFYWGTADAESLPNDEIGNLYRMHMNNKKWGSSKWCCLKRKLRPQVPIVEDMKKDGFWDAELEALEAPEPS
jgi:hypothetical protein